MAKVKDFGDRVRDRLKALGYVKNGRLDINGFSVEHGYVPSYVYRWSKGQVPRGQALIRLSRDLKASPEDLLGPPSPPPKRTPGSGYYVKFARTETRNLHYLRWSRTIDPQFALAA